ncbi:MAG: ribonuclease R [Rhodospirillales bacterium]|nr:ribonuclease R [Rhodospirillales bacterium]MDP6883422.1 ribonuclease R [Rhodospirillales bacterium]
MTKSPSKSAPFPTKAEILSFIGESPRPAGLREIARAFGLGRDQKMALKAMMRELKADGLIPGGRRRANTGALLPRVTVVEVTGTDHDGEVLARPVSWERDGPPPTVFMAPEKRGRPALGPGDRVLARMTPRAGGVYEGRTIRRLPDAPSTVLGVFDVVSGEGRLRPTTRGKKSEYVIARDDAGSAKPGELVQAEVLPGRKLGLRRARIVERLGKGDHPRAVSLIAIHDHGLPLAFDAGALDLAAAAGPAILGQREDLRDLALVTIDGADARDFDDAVWARPDDDGDNPGGWHLIIAIADVAWYVRPGDALDQAAFERGNSAYFPDRVVPMLPEALSNGWCSLKPDEDRPCLAAHLWIDAEGRLKRHRFCRGLMRSQARLTYEDVQAAADGAPDAATAPLAKDVIAPLYGAYEALAKARRERGVLEIDLPERRIVLDDAGAVVAIKTEDRLDSHKLIEEFMIAANVAAAETLEAARAPTLYRIHDEPSREKLGGLRAVLSTFGLKLDRGQAVRPELFNRILAKVAGTPHERVVNEVILRAQVPAQYGPDNIGHFGLSLIRYCHFTSPIRRYSDLVVHRALIRAGGLGEGEAEGDPRDLTQAGEHLSMTERRAAAAEWDTIDRFTAVYLAERVGHVFAGRVTGVTRFGLFVTLDETGGDGLIPMRSLPDDFYVHDAARHELRGRRGGRRFRLGAEVQVRLAEADPVTGGLIVELVEADSAARPRRTKRKARKDK